MKLVPSTDPILHTRAEPVTDIPSQVLPHLAEMLEILKEKPGLGLAATQVEIALRFFLFRATLGEKFRVAINPSFNPYVLGGRISKQEGCLSFPGRTAFMARWRSIDATWLSKHAAPQAANLTGQLAAVFQHELDHLDGKTIFSQ